DSKLSTIESARVQAHVNDCDECRARLAQLGAGRAEPPPLPPSTAAFPLRLEGEPAAEVARPAAPPELLSHPRYRLLEMINAGGMGAVFKAHDQVMGRTVALKVVGGGGAGAELQARFRREVTLLARLAHPNVVTALDAGQAGDTHFLVMEYVEGRTLD